MIRYVFWPDILKTGHGRGSCDKLGKFVVFGGSEDGEGASSIGLSLVSWDH